MDNKQSLGMAEKITMALAEEVVVCHTPESGEALFTSRGMEEFDEVQRFQLMVLYSDSDVAVEC